LEYATLSEGTPLSPSACKQLSESASQSVSHSTTR